MNTAHVSARVALPAPLPCPDCGGKGTAAVACGPASWVAPAAERLGTCGTCQGGRHALCRFCPAASAQPAVTVVDGEPCCAGCAEPAAEDEYSHPPEAGEPIQPAAPSERRVAARKLYGAKPLSDEAIARCRDKARKAGAA